MGGVLVLACFGYVKEDSRGKNYIVLSPWALEEQFEFINRRNDKSLLLWIDFQTVRQSTDFEARFAQINEIYRVLVRDKDFKIEWLYKFRGLIDISLARDTPYKEVDFSNFPNLKRLNCRVPKKMVGLEACRKVRELDLRNASSGNLGAICSRSKLEQVSFLRWSDDLIELTDVPNLTQIGVHYSPKVKRLSLLNSGITRIERIYIENAKNLDEIAFPANDFEIARFMVRNVPDHVIDKLPRDRIETLDIFKW